MMRDFYEPWLQLVLDTVGSVYKPNLGWKWGGSGCRRAISAVDGIMWDGDKWNNMQSDKWRMRAVASASYNSAPS